MVGLREGEEIIQIKRRHIITLIIAIAPLAFLFAIGLVGAVFVFFVPFSFPEVLTDSLPGLLDFKPKLLILYGVSILLIVVWQAAFILFATYYLDCWIVTNERTIHTELKSLFSRIVSSVPHATIQDITVNLKGIIPTILKYGDLQVQTAGKFHEFIFKQVPEPHKTKEIIFKAQKELQKKERLEGRMEPSKEGTGASG